MIVNIIIKNEIKSKFFKYYIQIYKIKYNRNFFISWVKNKFD